MVSFMVNFNDFRDGLRNDFGNKTGYELLQNRKDQLRLWWGRLKKYSEFHPIRAFWASIILILLLWNLWNFFAGKDSIWQIAKLNAQRASLIEKVNALKAQNIELRKIYFDKKNLEK